VSITIGTKCHIVANGVVFGVASNMFHGVVIEDGVYKVEVHGVMFILKDVKGQFTLWKGVNL
jgi:hypothetical protein